MGWFSGELALFFVSDRELINRMKNNSSMTSFNFDLIKEAHEKIKSWIIKTPLIKSDYLTEMLDAEIFLKLECLQKTGSFKVRGAFNSVLCLDEDKRRRGILTVSSGNHAVALAYVGKKLGLEVTAIMPETTPKHKIEKVRYYGGNVILHGKNYQEALLLAEKIIRDTQATFIHSYDDENVVYGHGTIGYEILQQLPDVDAVVIGIGGGALFAGVSQAVKSVKPDVLMVGVQPENAATLGKSLELGMPAPINLLTNTLADGLATGKIGAKTFEIIRKNLGIYVTVKEEDIAKAIFLLLKNDKILAEGAGAATVAASIKIADLLRGKKVVTIISGGNIDMEKIQKIIQTES